MTVKELRSTAASYGIKGYSKMNKAQLEEAVNNAQTQAQEQAHAAQPSQPAVVEYDPEFVEECYIPDYQDCPAVLDDVPEPRKQTTPITAQSVPATPAVIEHKEQPQPAIREQHQPSATKQKVTLPHMEHCPYCGSKHKPYFSYKEGNNASYATRRFNGGEYHEWKEARLTCRDCGHVVSLVFRKPYKGNPAPSRDEAMRAVVGEWCLQSSASRKPVPVATAEIPALATPKPHADTIRKSAGKYSCFTDEQISACTTRAQLAELFSNAANRKTLLDTFNRLNLCDPHRLLCSQEKLADYLANEIMIARQDQRQPLALGTLSDRVIHKGKAIVRLVAGAIGSFFKL